MPLAKFMRAMRARALLSQEELAQRSGLSVGTIRGIEAGRIRSPRGSSVHRLADALALTDADRQRLFAAASGQAVEREDVTPAQLPAVAAGFAGRAGELEALDETLAAGAALVVITGAAGVGKTTLAVHWAHRVAHRFPDGQLYVNLRGFDPGGDPIDPSAALHGFLQALAVAPARMPSTLDGQCGLHRSALAGRRMLIVLDNARDAAQVRPLLPGAPGCLTVVTSRDQLSGLVETEGARPLTLGVLSPAESRQLLALRLGDDRITGEAGAAGEIIARCAGLPLALAIVAARAALHPGFALRAVAAQLGQDPISGAGGLLVVLRRPRSRGGKAVPPARPAPGPRHHGACGREPHRIGAAGGRAAAGPARVGAADRRTRAGPVCPARSAARLCRRALRSHRHRGAAAGRDRAAG